MKKCEKCGKMIPNEAIFCSKCGFKNQQIKVEKILKEKKPKSRIIILCLICVSIIAIGIVYTCMKNNDDEKNGVNNGRTVIYNNTIYFIKNRILYKANADGTEQKIVKKLPHKQINQDGEDEGYSNITVYKNRIYAIRWVNPSMTNEYYIFSVRLDGTGYKKEVELPNIEKEDRGRYTSNIERFSIKNNYIYYICSQCDDNDEIKYSVYKQKIGKKNRVKIKYEETNLPTLLGEDIYYIKMNSLYHTSKIMKMNLDTGKESLGLDARDVNISSIGTMNVSKNQLIFSGATNIVWTKLGDNKKYNQIQVTSDSDDRMVVIVNSNEEEVIYQIYNIYSKEGKIYKLNLKSKKIEEILSLENLEYEIRNIDQVGDNIAVFGFLDEAWTKEFVVLVQKKEGIDYNNIIRRKIKQCQ